MTALAKPRDTRRRLGDIFSVPVAVGATIYQGALVALEGGKAVPGKTEMGLIALGRAEQTVTGIAAEPRRVDVRIGIFDFVSDASDPVTAADIGQAAYIVDDQTVAKTDGGGTRSAAGVVVDVEENGAVWLRIGI